MIDHPDTFGTALRQARTATGTSLRVLAERMHYSKGYLSKIENGNAPASLGLARAYDMALGTEGRLTAAFLMRALRQDQGPGAGGMEATFDIPAAPGHFTGREDEAGRVIEAIVGAIVPGRAPAVVIHGMPGIGKTALATHVAHTLRSLYPGGCLFIDFGGQPGPVARPRVHALLLRRLGIAAGDIPDDPGEARALYLSIASRRPVLIVADDVSTGAQVAALVPASSACGVIATSRRRLDALDDCRPIRLGPLSGRAAIALFRAVAAPADCGPDAGLARIAVACGGVPLAIRIAAAKFRQSGRDSAQLASLLASARTAWEQLDDGERSMERTLASGIRSLPEGGQATLAMLALHPAEAADKHAVAWLRDTTPQAVARDFAELQRHDLIAIDPDGRASPQALVRAFAEGLISDIDGQSRADALRRLIASYTRSASSAEAVITPLRYLPPQAGAAATTAPAMRFTGASQALAWCGAAAEVVPGLCSLAFELGMDDECWRLAYALRGYFFTIKALRPWVASHRVALRAAQRQGDPWAQAVTRNNLGMALVERGQMSAAGAQYQRALQILSAIGDDRGRATTLGHQSWASHVAGLPGLAISQAGQAIAMHRQRDDARSVAIMCRTMALAYARLGKHQEAVKCLAECAEALTGLDLPLDEAMMLNCLGEVHGAEGDWDSAEEFHALAAERGAACGAISEEVRAIKGLAASARATGARGRSEVLRQRAARLSARAARLARQHILNALGITLGHQQNAVVNRPKESGRVDLLVDDTGQPVLWQELDRPARTEEQDPVR
jgi:transcriptional regulator with XRE-family HTH domain/tetratricopeptide (TPR) repeat protein